MPPDLALARPRFVALLVALVLAACGQAPQGGLHGFPPAEVTDDQGRAARRCPASCEYVGQTTGSKEVEVRARVTGILEKKLFQEGAPVKAGPAAVRDRSQAAAGADRRASRPRSRARRRRWRRPSARSRG